MFKGFQLFCSLLLQLLRSFPSHDFEDEWWDSSCLIWLPQPEMDVLAGSSDSFYLQFKKPTTYTALCYIATLLINFILRKGM